MRHITRDMDKDELIVCTGKNLLPYPYSDGNITKNGRTFTVNNNGAVSWFGNHIGTNSIRYNFTKDETFSLQPGTYTFSVETDIVTDDANNVVWLYKTSTSQKIAMYSFKSKTPVTFTLTEETSFNVYSVFTPALPDGYMVPMIELGAEATAYEPYCGASHHHFETDRCKGGYFSVIDDYGLKVECDEIYQEQLIGKNLIDGDNVSLSNHYYPVSLKAGKYIARVYNNDLSSTGIRSGTTYSTFFLDSSRNAVVRNVHNGVEITEEQALQITEVVFYWNNAYYTGTATALCEQLENNTEATPYEPYCGGIPSPNPDYPQPIHCVKEGTKIVCRGKNLLRDNIDTSTTNYITTYGYKKANVKISSTYLYGSSSTSGTIGTVLSAGTYYFGYKHIDGLNPNNVVFEIVQNGITKSIPVNTVDSFDSEITINAIRMSTAIEIDADEFIKYDAWITDSSTSTSYEPYQEPCEVTVPTNLYEGDVWYPMTGKVVRPRWKEINGSQLSWRYVEQYHCLTSSALPNAGLYEDRYVNIYANRFPKIITGWVSSAADKIQLGRSISEYNIENIYPDISTETFNTLVKQWERDGDPLLIVYRLIEPITEQFDPQPIFAPQGTVHVISEPLDLEPKLSATMVVQF